MKTTLSVLLASTLIFVGATAGHAAQKKIKAFKYKNISSMMIMPGESADVGVESRERLRAFPNGSLLCAAIYLYRLLDHG